MIAKLDAEFATSLQRPFVLSILIKKFRVLMKRLVDLFAVRI